MKKSFFLPFKLRLSIEILLNFCALSLNNSKTIFFNTNNEVNLSSVEGLLN